MPSIDQNRSRVSIFVRRRRPEKKYKKIWEKYRKKGGVARRHVMYSRAKTTSTKQRVRLISQARGAESKCEKKSKKKSKILGKMETLDRF